MAIEVYIHCNDKGIWISDIFVEVLSKFICDVFEQNGLGMYSETLQTLYSDCDSNRKGENEGMVTILLDEITIAADKQELIAILEQAKSAISSLGAELSLTYLSQLEASKDPFFRNGWEIPIKTSSLTGTLNIMQQLLSGQWVHENYQVNFIGYPHVAGKPTI